VYGSLSGQIGGSRNKERFLNPHTARDPNKIDEIELESEDLPGMICHPPKVMESGGSFIYASCGGGFLQPMTV